MKKINSNDDLISLRFVKDKPYKLTKVEFIQELIAAICMALMIPLLIIAVHMLVPNA